MSIGDHAADAGALLEHLGIERAHVAGHSSGAAIAAQLALDAPRTVHSLMLLEPSLLSLPAGQAFLEQAAPVFETYGSGDRAGALAMFMAAVSGLAWPDCEALLEERLPGALAQALSDADTFFGVELPSLAEWAFGAEQAAAIHQPVLSVVGTETLPLWHEVADFLRSSLPQVEECRVDGVGHLLHIQRPEPVARGMAEFLARNVMVSLEAVGGR